ncbi:probable inactive shikimate kinase like 1, chloroplastic isoform X2 [Rhodamnia argentea]|uniref:Probable inactive shikimate kinase like 1, chloroplastic isoform X2 n=1 Tax=Rhodamnia argentea TaxID=178133 RepID=A0A8B8MYG1_9MYRT|nr:probable inactive shikimate kinase like 1, chloroplastic isoform X2 [Rhodamnia argentea]
MATVHFSTYNGLKFRGDSGAIARSSVSPFSTASTSSSPAAKPRLSRLRASLCRKSLTATRALPEEIALSAPPEVVVDPTLALKKAADVAPELKGTSIFLVGMKSSIKTQLAKLLAEALRYYFFDSDALIEEAAGGEASAKLFRETDEQGFRESEGEVLKQLSSTGRLVVCAGDGAVQSSTNLGFLRHGISIWIDVPLDIVARGLVEDHPSSQLSTPQTYSEVLAQLAALYEETRVGYATADANVSLQKIASRYGHDDFSAVTVEDLAMEVLKEIEKLTLVKKMMQEAGRPF